MKELVKEKLLYDNGDVVSEWLYYCFIVHTTSGISVALQHFLILWLLNHGKSFLKFLFSPWNWNFPPKKKVFFCLFATKTDSRQFFLSISTFRHFPFILFSPQFRKKNSVIWVSPPPPQVNVFPVWCHAKGKQREGRKKSIILTHFCLVEFGFMAELCGGYRKRKKSDAMLKECQVLHSFKGSRGN